MNYLLADYLEALQQQSSQQDLKDFYLWPRTPMGKDHQDKIRERVGSSDYEVDVSSSRPALILRQISYLKKHLMIADDFSLVDIACGDAVVLWQIKKAFPKSSCYGIDCYISHFATHKTVENEGVRLYNIFIQNLFASGPPEKFDIALMLNTYRGWISADLREHEKDLPQKAEAWFEHHARFTVVTATRDQIVALKQKGFFAMELGKGEDDSVMVCLSIRRFPSSFARRIIGWPR